MAHRECVPTTRFIASKGGGKRHAQDASRVLGMIAEPTGTDGHRILSHQCWSTFSPRMASSIKDSLHSSTCLAVFPRSFPHSSARVHVSLIMASQRKNGLTWCAVSVNTTTPCARWPLITACPPRQSGVCCELLTRKERDESQQGSLFAPPAP